MKDQTIEKGSKVVATWGANKKVMTVALKPKIKSGVKYLTLEDQNGNREPIEMLEQWWRLAEDSEIKSGVSSE